jgi:hypothetical protein
MTTETARSDRHVCTGCGKTIDACCFCDGEDCPCALCYMCVVVGLGESLRHPHDHGG